MITNKMKVLVLYIKKRIKIQVSKTILLRLKTLVSRLYQLTISNLITIFCSFAQV